MFLIIAEFYTMEKGAYSGKGQWHRLLDVGWGGMGCVASLLFPLLLSGDTLGPTPGQWVLEEEEN